MKLYLMRHGIAIERGTYSEDDERPLTEIGIQKTERVVQQLQRLNLSFDLIVTSPLVRAHQTAVILRQEYPHVPLEISDHLAPEGSLPKFLTWLFSDNQPDNSLDNQSSSRSDYSQPLGKDSDPSIIAIGHEPDLGNWAELLLYGQTSGAILLKKAGIIGLHLPTTGEAIAQSQLFWLTSPKLLAMD
jgi:phosphohistidine phosphatase